VFIASLVEAKLEEERGSIRADAKADVDRAFQLASFERTAHSLIAESKLPESWQADLRARFSLVENAPTDGLDVKDDVAEDGTVAKPALDKLRESVEAEITKERERLREASATRVRSSAPVVIAESKDGEKPDGEKQPKGDQPYWSQILRESGVQDPDTAYAIEA
jgi:hypothetical protein